jgi:hypothetical protein
MKVLALYHPKSDHGGQVEDYARDYKRLKNGDIELVSLETVEGAERARIYDITSYPAILVMADDGQLHKFWQGELPAMNELESYFHA